MAGPSPIVLQNVSHAYGRGDLRREVLHEVSADIGEGEIVLFTGPSGSGKTTLLTLVGALRSAQTGSLQVLGTELRGASERRLVSVRRRIGYVFQAHNLVASLSARENVEVALQLHPELRDAKGRARAMLESVGLGDHVDAFPRSLSGGQRQRVAVARALATEPRIVLADEPTASLDKKTGRDVIELLKDLARRQGVTVIVVTHDNRILDTADRVLHLEDGRLSSPTTSVMNSAQSLMSSMAQTFRRGDVARQVSAQTPESFLQDLENLTAQSRTFHDVLRSTQVDAVDSMLEQVLEAFSQKVCELLEAEASTVFLVDQQRRILWSKFARGPDDQPLEIRLPFGAGIAGTVAETGEPLNITDAYESPLFDPSTDERTGYRTKSVLCVPMRDDDGRVFAVIQVLNKRGGDAFDAGDEADLEAFIPPIGALLESWVDINRTREFSAPTE